MADTLKYTVVGIDLTDAANGNFDPAMSVFVEHVEVEDPSCARDEALARRESAHDYEVVAVFRGWLQDDLYELGL